MSYERELGAMRARGEIEGAPRDLAAIAEHLQRAREALDTARREAARSGFSAVVLLWEGAALQALLAVTNAAGYRLRSAQGHHRVALEVGRLLLRDEGLFKRLRQLMHDRQAAVYDASPVDLGLVESYLDDVQELLDVVGASFPGSRRRARDSRRRISDDDPDTDAWAVANGYVSVTPITFDLTAGGALRDLRGWSWRK